MSHRRKLARLLLGRQAVLLTMWLWPPKRRRDLPGQVLASLLACVRIGFTAATGLKPWPMTEVEARAVRCARRRLEARNA